MKLILRLSSTLILLFVLQLSFLTSRKWQTLSFFSWWVDLQNLLCCSRRFRTCFRAGAELSFPMMWAWPSSKGRCCSAWIPASLRCGALRSPMAWASWTDSSRGSTRPRRCSWRAERAGAPTSSIRSFPQISRWRWAKRWNAATRRPSRRNRWSSSTCTARKKSRSVSSRTQAWGSAVRWSWTWAVPRVRWRGERSRRSCSSETLRSELWLSMWPHLAPSKLASTSLVNRITKW